MSGEKHFLLAPPIAIPYLKEKIFPCATCKQNQETKKWDLIPDRPKRYVNWISINTNNLQSEQENFFLDVVLKKGEVKFFSIFFFFFFFFLLNNKKK